MMIGAPLSFSYLISSLNCVIPQSVMFVGLRGDAVSSEWWSRFQCVPADDNNHDPDEVLRVPGYPTTPPDVIHIQQIYEVVEEGSIFAPHTDDDSWIPPWTSIAHTH